MSALAVLASLAMAAPPSVVVLPPSMDPGTERFAAAFAAALTAELAARPEVVRLASGVTGADPAARAALDRARAAFEALELERAMAGYKAALPLLLDAPATADHSELALGYLELAAAALRLGEEAEAKAALLELVRMAPRAEAPPGFPPVFQRELEKARQRLARQPTGRLTVDGPQGATVSLDGRDVGPVPAVEELPVGRYGVKVVRGAGELFATRVEVTEAGAAVDVTFSPGAALAPVGPILDAAAVREVVRRSRGAGAALAIVAHVSGGERPAVRAAVVVAETSDVAALSTVRAELAGVAASGDLAGAATSAARAAQDVAEQVVRRVVSFGVPASLPVDLGAREASAPVSLVPAARPVGRPDAPPLSRYADEAFDAPYEVRRPVPAWVWVLTAGVVVAGLGVGAAFGYQELTRPVTGRVTATW